MGTSVTLLSELMTSHLEGRTLRPVQVKLKAFGLASLNHAEVSGLEMASERTQALTVRLGL